MWYYKVFLHIKTVSKQEVKKGNVGKNLKQQIYKQLYRVVKMYVVINHLKISHKNIHDYVLSCWECKYQFDKSQETDFFFMNYCLSGYTVKSRTQIRDWMHECNYFDLLSQKCICGRNTSAIGLNSLILRFNDGSTCILNI